jgi:MFS family permease
MTAESTASRRNYAVVTLAYWADTLADGAIRTLVLFYFYNLGYNAWQVASLFLFYEFFGILTNLFGGHLGARFGLKSTLFLGLGTQLLALGMLGARAEPGLTVAWVMASQALSGIAKDLTKMSSKSAVKLVAGEGAGRLYRWVSALTGSKNALKGAGFFLGGWMLSTLGFQSSVHVLAGVVGAAMLLALLLLRGDLGSKDAKAKFNQILSPNPAVNRLAVARLFLFGARDVWFVVAVPVFLSSVLGWKFWQAGGFMAAWVIGYGMVQALTPALLRGSTHGPDGRTATVLAFVLALLPAGIAVALRLPVSPGIAVVGGLLIFGVVFALNSAVHSYLILAYTDRDKVAKNVGLYYMANACGRLAGTVLSGLLYQWGGLLPCLLASSAFLLATALISIALPRLRPAVSPLALPMDGGE